MKPPNKIDSVDKWFITTKIRPHARVRLFCFPYAGGAASIYRQWPSLLPPEVEVTAIELPGRGMRLAEPAFRSVATLVDQLTEVLIPRIDGEFAFFGHSMGAVIAFELAREFHRRGKPAPRWIFVSGRGAPHVHRTDPPIYDLPAPEFVNALGKLNGTPKEVLEHKELMDLMMPILRADFELVQTYEYTPGAPLDCPITVFGGLEDPEVPYDTLPPWKEQTAKSFKLHMLPGDHFFLRSAQGMLLALLAADLIRQSG